ncbi:hypothetical protein PHLGIDRAFT_18769 [Phlebiopsis gigantea 11061_1 CR5-6]|uniref:Peptidase M3A/M3B catalytic domain-containing protein n=1 Tax=Phlebiopsis gigantea (strain 11061_1 CR5-6) TaxID=745531 RepID=A0A0C3SCL2_PHLG1|nr:hypothetical protein PHLGIDRAFT_18769 [Phlebiopsis gigantea 11061_1 CR5-6]
MSPLTPPQAAPSWTEAPEVVRKLAKDYIERDKEILDKIASLPHSECKFNTVFLALAHREAEFYENFELLKFYEHVSPSKELRDASSEAAALQSDHQVEVSMRLDLFQAKQAALSNIRQSGLQLEPEEQRLVDKMIQDGTRAGLALPEADREELSKLKKELSSVCLQFIRSYSGEKGTVAFTGDELRGVPADVISGYKESVEDGQTVYRSTFKAPDLFPLLKFAEIPETRKRAYEANERRLEVNVPVFAKMLNLRREIATLLGYDSWADYATEVRMVKSAQGVFDFLDELEQRLRPVALKEREVLLAMKQEEHADKSLAQDDQFNGWDWRYYDRKFTEKALKLDDNLVKEYFPVEHVVSTVLDIYQNLLGVEFVDVEGTTWHPDVKTYAVWDKDAKDETNFLGYLYLDLYPRDSKFPHAAVWALINGYTRPDGTRNYPVTAMVANLATPQPDKPALIGHAALVTFFHEMGHAFHNLLSKTQFSRFHGTSVVDDFVEAPSKMLENWCWEPAVLTRMSSHYETKEPMSLELAEKIAKSRYVNVGLFYLRQLFFCKFDIAAHTSKDENTDYTQLWHKLKEDITLTVDGEPTPGQSWFVHLAGGHDAGYYGYTYALVFACDMYATVFEGGPLDPARGLQYREKILLPGGSRDEIDSLTDFLGRPPNSAAFVKALFG